MIMSIIIIITSLTPYVSSHLSLASATISPTHPFSFQPYYLCALAVLPTLLDCFLPHYYNNSSNSTAVLIRLLICRLLSLLVVVVITIFTTYYAWTITSILSVFPFFLL